MGCDIHLSVERRLGDGSWQNVDRRHEADDGYITNHPTYYNDRNYDLFSILAGVRNGRGFAGSETGDGFVPMSKPRGVPDDASPEYQKWVDQWAEDGHSHSFLTVAEVMAYDWTQTTKKRGWVNLKEWALYKAKGAPETWSSAVGGGGVRHVAISEVEAAWSKIESNASVWDVYHGREVALSALADALGFEVTFGSLGTSNVYTQVEWEIPYYRPGRVFLGEVLPRLWRLGKPEDVRVVFFFDN